MKTNSVWYRNINDKTTFYLQARRIIGAVSIWRGRYFSCFLPLSCVAFEHAKLCTRCLVNVYEGYPFIFYCWTKKDGPSVQSQDDLLLFEYSQIIIRLVNIIHFDRPKRFLGILFLDHATLYVCTMAHTFKKKDTLPLNGQKNITTTTK